MSGDIEIGIIKWFDNAKGFGVLKALNRDEYFIHISNIQNKPENVFIAMPFIFEIAVNEEKKIAHKCRIPSSKNDFHLGISKLLPVDCTISFYTTIKGKGIKGNPYVKDVLKSYNILDIYILKLTNNKSSDEIYEMYKSTFDTYCNNNWNIEDLKKYIRLTKDRIKAINIYSGEEEKLDSYEIDEFFFDNYLRKTNKIENEELSNKLIEYYYSKLSDSDKFELWRDFVLSKYNSSGVKTELGLSEEVLLKYAKRLSTNELCALNNFKISEYSLNVILEPIFKTKIIEINHFDEVVTVYESLDENFKIHYFDLMLESISPELLFRVWKNKLYSIDKLRKNIKRYRFIDFSIPKEIILRNIAEIDTEDLFRIQKCFEDSDKLLMELISFKIKEREVNKNNFSRYIAILKKLDPKFKKEQLDRIFCIPEQFYIELLSLFSTGELLDLYQEYQNDHIYTELLKSIDFHSLEDINLVFSSLTYSNELGQYVMNKIIDKFEVLPTDQILNCINFLIKNGNKINIEIIKELLYRNLDCTQLVDIFSLSKKFSILEQKVIVTGISKYIDLSLNIRNEEIIELVEINSKDIILSLFDKYENIVNQKLYLSKLLKNEVLKLISDKKLVQHLKLFLGFNPLKILKYTIKKRKEIYDDLSKDVKLNERIVAKSISIFQSNLESLKPFVKSSSDLNTIFRFIEDPMNNANVSKINMLFKKHNYAYQSIILKFLISEVRANNINADAYYKIQEALDLKELAALMIKSFTVNRVSSRDELMNIMNLKLKEHFIYLEEMSEETKFKNLYSIRNLVKQCNGRKSFSGLNYWKKGNISRWYVQNLEPTSIEIPYNMYCEGKFWKLEEFYDSQTNRPFTDKKEVFWCRNDMCMEVNDTIQYDNHFSKWTLSEISQIFEINLDRLAFIYIAGWLNRMQSIFDRLKCHSCNNYLRPKSYKPTILGYYAVPLFWCLNSNCPDYNKIIRFTHCRGCSKILDSRECKVCSKCNWLICDDSTCSKCGCGANHQPVKVEY